MAVARQMTVTVTSAAWGTAEVLISSTATGEAVVAAAAAAANSPAPPEGLHVFACGAGAWVAGSATVASRGVVEGEHMLLVRPLRVVRIASVDLVKSVRVPLHTPLVDTLDEFGRKLQLANVYEYGFRAVGSRHWLDLRRSLFEQVAPADLGLLDDPRSSITLRLAKRIYFHDADFVGLAGDSPSLRFGFTEAETAVRNDAFVLSADDAIFLGGIKAALVHHDAVATLPHLPHPPATYTAPSAVGLAPDLAASILAAAAANAGAPVADLKAAYLSRLTQTPLFGAAIFRIGSVAHVAVDRHALYLFWGPDRVASFAPGAWVPGAPAHDALFDTIPLEGIHSWTPATDAITLRIGPDATEWVCETADALEFAYVLSAYTSLRALRAAGIQPEPGLTFSSAPLHASPIYSPDAYTPGSWLAAAAAGTAPALPPRSAAASTVLRVWLLIVAVAALFATSQGYTRLDTVKTKQFSLAVDEVSPLAGRLWAVWTLLAACLRTAAAFDQTNAALFLACIASFLIAGGFYAAELLVYGTIPLRNALPPAIVSSFSVLFMGVLYVRWFGLAGTQSAVHFGRRH